MRFYRAICTKEFYWHGRTYKSGSPITINKDEADKLAIAGVIGGISIMPEALDEDEKEYAVVTPIETAMRQHGGKQRRR